MSGAANEFSAKSALARLGTREMNLIHAKNDRSESNDALIGLLNRRAFLYR